MAKKRTGIYTGRIPRTVTLTAAQTHVFHYGKAAAYELLMEELKPQLKGKHPIELLDPSGESLEVLHP
jgi:hypothetical protein